jgi:hypothetical protein
MSEQQLELVGPDLAEGVPVSTLVDKLITAVEGAARIVTRTTAEAEARLRSARLLARLLPADAT